MALTQDQWLSRYRARILYHQPDMGAELLRDYVTVDAYEVMKLDFPDDPELAVDIDPDLAYVHQQPVRKTASVAKPRRSRDTLQED